MIKINVWLKEDKEFARSQVAVQGKEINKMLIREAIKIIDIAESYDGVLIPVAPKTKITCVKFTIMFPTTREMRRFERTVGRMYSL